MTKREQNIVIGCVLGDGYFQKTGERNARLRLEHSEKQRHYIFWKWQELKRYMQDRPKRILRFNPVWKKTYAYYRCQSHASPTFGNLQRIFYDARRKRIPKTIQSLVRDPLALAVWYMDDGYYYRRDRTAYLYLSRVAMEEEKRLHDTFRSNFHLHPVLERKKDGNMNFKFPVKETRKLIHILAPHVIPSMRYKLGEEPRID